MDRRSLIVVALLASMVLAGCGAWVEQTETNSTPNRSAPSNGSEVPSFRFQEHAEALADTSYAVEIDVRRENNRSNINQTIGVRSDPDTERILTYSTRPNLSDQTYFEAPKIYVQRQQQGNVTYAVRDAGENRSFDTRHLRNLKTNFIASIYQAGSFEENRTVTIDGRNVTEWTLQDPGEQEGIDLETVNGTILIAEDGVIERATVHIEGRRNGTVFLNRIDYRVLDRGNVTVESPDWLDDARATADGTTAENSG